MSPCATGVESLLDGKVVFAGDFRNGLTRGTSDVWSACLSRATISSAGDLAIGDLLPLVDHHHLQHLQK